MSGQTAHNRIDSSPPSPSAATAATSAKPICRRCWHSFKLSWGQSGKDVGLELRTGEQDVAMAEESIRIVAVDPRCEDAIQLIGALSNELAEMYDFTDNGAGDFTPEDALVARSSFLIGFIGNRPIACGAFRPLDGDTAEIKRMFVVPAWRGQGYSKVILNKLEDLAKEAGYAAIRLETGNRQPVAIRLYERSGYQRIPNYGIYTRSERSVCFEKQL